MSDLPIALTFDLDPDLFDESVAPTQARTKISWRCITEGIPLIRDRVGEVAEAAGLKPAPSWFVRVDNQIGDLWGRPAWLLEEYGAVFEALETAGEEIAWHPHLYRRSDTGWEQETDPSALADKMEAALADMKRFGYAPRCARIGEAYGSNAIMEAHDRLGIEFDSTAMAGRKRVDAERIIDWEATPHRAYRPSQADHRIPGKPARDVVEIPMSMQRVKADYDAEPFLRYLDLSFHPRALAHGLDDLVRDADYLVTVTHPSAFLSDFEPAGGHGLVAFDPQALTRNLDAVLDAAGRHGRRPRFLTISQLGDELRRELP
ncbi:hypothetical protein E5163_16230 [Marinicauda algicola]|uniref:Polysaccharide deacetylase n=1 Tax=Marinicauda algicola TaxID=2029849 RepID=A0A4S2GVX7_9PROT|nr:hypothetical protein [Marinicauda algicola]TGY87260.1 hypothetical protein E5163_16230 [Marinicauda algicola]